MNTIYKSEVGAKELRRRYQAGLDAWPVPAEHIRVPTPEGETFVVVSGPEDAPPVLLLHGSGSNTSMWLRDVASWAQHFRTYALDLIGEPGLSAPSRPPLASDAYALWLDEVLDDLGVESTSVVGMSLGGWVGLDYAIRRPERVTRLALLCPGGVGRQRMGGVVKALLLRPFGRWGMRRSVVGLAGLDPAHGPDVLDHVMLTFEQFRPRTERLPIFPDEVLSRLTLPMMVTVGARDAMFDSQGTARRIRQCVPHATVNVLPEVGHSIFGQTESILAFLRDGHDELNERD
ncbi:alpha/beta fold hydrolase [Streptomyces sp. NPDC003077]|uniref:alpha/beta fold hydrolase n=1 Tax=Streptomyces sp. NPDC003077 TaxID=3154443 RepID=UPI0033AD7A33